MVARQSLKTVAFAEEPKRPDEAQEQGTKNEWLPKVTKGGRQKDWGSKFLTFCLSGSMTTSHRWEIGKKYCLFSISVCVYIRWHTDPSAGKDLVKPGRHVTHWCGYPELSSLGLKTSAIPRHAESPWVGDTVLGSLQVETQNIFLVHCKWSVDI